MDISSFHVVRRRIYCVFVFCVPLSGLSIRANAAQYPKVFTDFAPDILWAFLVFALIAALAPRWPTAKGAALALGFAYFMELSQLYQAPWMNELRANKIGGLLLGFGFMWSDLICYLVGIAFGIALDLMLQALLPRLNKRWSTQS